MEPHIDDGRDIAPSDRFIGLTKTQFLAVIVSMMLAIFLAQAWQLYETSSLASKTAALTEQNAKQITEGATAHNALCAIHDNVLRHRDESVKFLRLTVDERVAQYGEIGRIPEASIRKDIKTQEDTLRALRGLHCQA